MQTGKSPSSRVDHVLRFMYKADGVRGFFKCGRASPFPSASRCQAPHAFATAVQGQRRERRAHRTLRRHPLLHLRARAHGRRAQPRASGSRRRRRARAAACLGGPRRWQRERRHRGVDDVPARPRAHTHGVEHGAGRGGGQPRHLADLCARRAHRGRRGAVPGACVRSAGLAALAGTRGVCIRHKMLRAPRQQRRVACRA